MKSTCTFLCKCMFYLIFMLKTKLSVDKKTLKKKQNKKLGMALLCKKITKKTTKQNKQTQHSWLCIFNLFAMITTSIPQTFIAQ